MSKTIRKVFFVWQSDKEKIWLEDMAKLGYILKSLKLFKYEFDKCEPQDLVYQFDFQIIGKKAIPEYLEMFQDWILADSFGGWYYFYKKRENNEKDEIYNDNESKRQMFNRILGFLIATGFPVYYQMLIMFPNMDPSRFEFPSFYFFFRIIVIIILMIHLYAFMNVILIYRSFQKTVKE